MQTPDELNQAFAIPGQLAFDEPHPGMPRARVTSPACSSDLYLQGAHLATWQPAGHDPVLFLSDRSAFTPGKAIRGGIPVVFPWFGAPETSPVHPPAGSASHGFARVSPWTLRFAAAVGDDLHLTLTLNHNDQLRVPGFDQLQLGLDLILGNTLKVQLTTVNVSADQSFLLEEALHSYLHVGDVERAAVQGLAGTAYLDKPDGFRRKIQTEAELRFEGEVDRPYLNTTTPVSLVDPVLGRRLTVKKQGSETTVVWNPAAALASKLPDLAEGAWRRFACVETANAAENVITLKPRETHTMSMELNVERL